MNYTDPREALNGARHYGPGATNRTGDGRPHGEPSGGPDAPPRALPFMRGSDFANRPIPARPWMAVYLIPDRTVTLLGGDGGTGKSLLALQLAVACATGREWIGRPVRKGAALYLSAEDDRDELHRRLAAILEAEGLNFEALGDLSLLSLAGDDALLATVNRATGLMVPTPLLAALDAKAAALRPAVVVVDTAADVYGGDESNRAQVRQFVGALRGLALRHATAVVLLAHPSVAGLASGSGLSGSTAWNNSVRSRLYLSRVAEQGFEPNPDARVLRTMKANYSAAGSEIGLTYREGRFVAEAPASRLDRMAATAKAERVFTKLLRQFTAEGRAVNPSGGANYAPKVFAEHPGAEGCTRRALLNAMNALLERGAIRVERTGPPSRQTTRLAEGSPDA